MKGSESVLVHSDAQITQDNGLALCAEHTRVSWCRAAIQGCFVESFGCKLAGKIRRSSIWFNTTNSTTRGVFHPDANS